MAYKHFGVSLVVSSFELKLDAGRMEVTHISTSQYRVICVKFQGYKIYYCSLVVSSFEKLIRFKQ